MPLTCRICVGQQSHMQRPAIIQGHGSATGKLMHLQGPGVPCRKPMSKRLRGGGRKSATLGQTTPNRHDGPRASRWHVLYKITACIQVLAGTQGMAGADRCMRCQKWEQARVHVGLARLASARRPFAAHERRSPGGPRNCSRSREGYVVRPSKRARPFVVDGIKKTIRRLSPPVWPQWVLFASPEPCLPGGDRTVVGPRHRPLARCERAGVGLLLR